MNPFTLWGFDLIVYTFTFLDKISLRTVAQVSWQLRTVAGTLIWREATLKGVLSVFPTRLLREARADSPGNDLIISDCLTAKDWMKIRLATDCICSLKIDGLSALRNGPSNISFYTSLSATIPGGRLFPKLNRLSLVLDNSFIACTQFLIHLLSEELRELRIVVQPRSSSWSCELYPLVCALLAVLPNRCPRLTVLGLLFWGPNTEAEMEITTAVLNSVKAMEKGHFKRLIMSSVHLPPALGCELKQSESLGRLKTLHIDCICLPDMAKFLEELCLVNLQELGIFEMARETDEVGLCPFFNSLARCAPHLEYLTLRAEAQPYDETDTKSEVEWPLISLSPSSFLPLLQSHNLRRISMPRDDFAWTSDTIMIVMKLLSDVVIDTGPVPDILAIF